MNDLTKHRIVVVGAGAIGGLAGTYLSDAGYGVTLTDKWMEHVEALRTKGLYTDGVRGVKHFDVRACPTTELAEPLDMLFLGVKSHHTVEAMESIQHLLTPETIIVSLQNGFNYETLQEYVEPSQIVGTVPNYGAGLVDPGHIEFVYEGPLHIGELNGEITPRIRWLERAFKNLTDTHVSTNIVGEIWGKLCSFSQVTMTALADDSMFAVLSVDKYGRLSIILVAEALKVADAAGISIPATVSFDPELYRLRTPEDTSAGMSPSGPVLASLEEQVEYLSHYGEQDTHQYVKIGSGVWWDIAYRQRPSETRMGLTGAVVEKARQYGVPLPLNERLADMIYQIERGERSMGWENLEELDDYRQELGLELP